MYDSRNTEFGLPPEEFPLPREPDHPLMAEDFGRAGEESRAPAEEFQPPAPELIRPGTYPWQEDKPRQTRHVLRAAAYVTAAALVVLVGLGPMRGVLRGGYSTGPSGSVTEPSGGDGGTVPIVAPVEENHLSIRQILAENPDWYAADRGVYLHFNEGVGWTFDGTNFHRLTWQIEDSGSGERLYADFGYAYVSGPGAVTIGAFTTEMTVDDQQGYSLYTRAGIEGDDYAMATFAPVDSIPADASVVESFGDMSAGEMLEAIGSFTPTQAPRDPSDYAALMFYDDKCGVDMFSGQTIRKGAEYPYRLSPSMDTEEVSIMLSGGSTVEGRLSGVAEIRQDAVYFYLINLTDSGFTEFTSGPVSGIVPPERVAMPITEQADEAFPELINLTPNGSVPGYGVLDEEYILVNGNIPVVAGRAYNKETVQPDGVRYDAATNTLTLENFTGKSLEANLMGNGLTVNLVGENHVGSVLVWGFMYGGSIKFTGDGALYVNEQSQNPWGITMNAEGSQTCIMVDRNVTLEAYGYEGAVMVYDTTMEKAIYYLGPNVLTGGMRSMVYGEGEDYHGYSIIDAYNRPATHVRFGR